jgi:flavin reductase (DIM6/NTAB) family NADH-FMN oxidoreductase RutF
MSGSIAALFQCLTQGVYVVGVANGEMRDAFTAAWVMQVSFDPLLLALSICQARPVMHYRADFRACRSCSKSLMKLMTSAESGS